MESTTFTEVGYIDISIDVLPPHHKLKKFSYHHAIIFWERVWEKHEKVCMWKKMGLMSTSSGKTDTA